MVEALLAAYRPHHAGGRLADTDRAAELRRGRAADAVHRVPREAGCCATTWTRSPRASASVSSRPATGCPRCRRRARAACRSSSCGWIRRAMSASASPPPAFRSRASAARCPRWVVHAAFATPGTLRVQVAELTRRRHLPVLRAQLTGPAAAWGEPPPRRMSSRWAATWGMPATWSTPMASTWTGRGSASACRAGCATGHTAAAAPSRRWRTGWRWTRIWRATARTVPFEPLAKR